MAENKDNGNGIGRRDLIKGLATVPVLGALWYGSLQKKAYDAGIRESILDELKVKMVEPPASGSMSGDPIRLGIIGFGIRGTQLVRASGFATPQWKESMKEGAMKNSKDTRLKDFLNQDNLNIRFTAVCDLFDVRAEDALAAVTTPDNQPKRYRHYQDLLAADDVDAVIIATPDHWHAQMAIDAAKAGKHVYVEKCMTRTIPETFALRDVVKQTGIVFQLGHQHRQTESFLTAQDIIKKNVLGHVSLIQTNTNRNSDNGAWQYTIHEKASPETIDWEQFLGNAPKIPFNAEHFFRWRKWWEYGTGLSSDLLTHEFDSINTILKMGIPSSVTSSGGVYTHKDGRDVPDVFQAVMEYPDYGDGMTFIYSATLGNQYNRTNVLMGHDGTMELGKNLTVYADSRSSRYSDMLKDGTITPDLPLYAYRPGNKGVDGVTSATAKYFAAKGLLYTYRDGKKVDSTHLHIREWLSCIRHGGQPSCHIDNGFEEAIAAHMATLSYRTGKRIEWDHATESIVDPNEEIQDRTLLG
ncbi:Gfo/Idh/MocA family oxidoreductase [Flammeovirgaceae bacterium SG7u.111]|nr:Gfo/Idh/MocA family oxidoreductase [Flammeovirgaceae bacterium SG7u.132]WPO37783.1 Gfo/Idh/MocA family oxidoreductase [Flammeovirgaceae bacterium SG7u.111]